MIIGFTGTPGSGKSYEAVKKVLDNLRMGRVVYTNIEGMDDPTCQETIKALSSMDDYEFSQRFYFLAPHEIREFWKHCKRGSLIVIDEVHKYFNSRDWQSDSNKEFGNWASTHRHEGYDVVLLTQDMEKVDKAVRSLVEWTYEFRKINYFGAAVQNKYKCESYAGEDVDGKPLSRSVRTYNKKIFLCYKSYVSKDVKELGIMRHVNVLRHPVFFIIPVVLVFILYMLFFVRHLPQVICLAQKKLLSETGLLRLPRQGRRMIKNRLM